MRIIDSYPEMTVLCQNMHRDFDRDLWKGYASGILPGLAEKIEKDSAGYDFNSQILPVLTLAMGSREKLETAHQSFLVATDNLEKKVCELTGSDIRVDIVFYLGLCNGAGWATELDGHKTVLLGAEKIVELGWHDIGNMTGLIYHELGHIWHDIAGNAVQRPVSRREESIWQLYREGLAMYFEQLLTGDLNHYHQDKGGWLSWCISNKRELNNEYLRRMRANESTREFFGDWNSYRGYSNVGYFLGCEFVKWLSEDYSLQEISGFGMQTLYERFAEYAG